MLSYQFYSNVGILLYNTDFAFCDNLENIIKILNS